MAKYHLSEDGNPRPCRATKRPCRFGGAGDHYETPQQALAALEQKFENANSETLSSYNKTVEAYIAGSPAEVSEGMAAWMDRSFSSLPEGARLIELGAGGGRDARYLKSLGFDVVPTDGSSGFVSHLKNEFPNARQVDILKDPIPFGDGVVATAVFLHFSKKEAELGFQKVADSLPEGAPFAITLKEGKGEEWSSEKIDQPRFFKYWQEEELRESLAKAGFGEVHIERDGIWLNVNAVKSTAPPEDYRLNHQPNEDGALAHEVDTHFPDFYSNPRLYMFGTKAYKESAEVLKSIRGNPEAEVTIYRAVPDKAYGIEPSNWVSLSKSYAEDHGKQFEGPDWPVISMKVKAKDLRTPGDDINEFGYYPAGG